jgi:hypothetical protein
MVMRRVVYKQNALEIRRVCQRCLYLAERPTIKQNKNKINTIASAMEKLWIAMAIISDILWPQIPRFFVGARIQAV